MSLKKSLLLEGQRDHYWLASLRSALSALNRDLVVVSEAEMSRISWCEYDPIILEAGGITNLAFNISLIHLQNPQARIVVFSPSPDWKEAREAMLAGAADYARKSLNEDYILRTLRKSLDR